jgi:NADH:ubiquinone oxidoreductase subunit 5 (subunit L)/multisubunit Na+/H+ antiporter MnhA subunit/multisubunit Na+/H+ antiporter MnhB subunit
MSIETAILWVVFLPLLGHLLPALAGRWLGSRVGWLALIFPLACTALLLYVARRVGAEPHVAFAWAWMPSLGVELGFLIDGLSLIFALMVAGMGTLIVLYATSYLDDHIEHHGRFYAYLILFMAAMLGTVLADHVLTLFIFWELTGLSSFLLIGFLHEQKTSRVGARQALLVTSLTGLAMLIGLLLLGREAGTYRISEWLTGLPGDLLHSTRGQTAVVLILIGAFGKSAQFPFHFWLPNAMAAPTPVSAYLHSATMVKLGVFLCARFFPVLSASDLWAPLLLATGFTTMLLGAGLALRQNDLKALLAFTTVSQLGFLCGSYGLGAWTGIRFDYLHILNHTFYKGGLFMLAGLIDHVCHTRDIRELGGLARRLPATTLTAALGLASMAALPGTTGFLSKEVALADLLTSMHVGQPGAQLALGAMILAAVLNVAIAVRLFARIFLGAPRSNGAAHAQRPALRLILPPSLLILTGLGLGLYPHAWESLAHGWRVPGLQLAEPGHLFIWHGWTPELMISTGALLIGSLLALVGGRLGLFGDSVPRLLQFDLLFERGLKLLVATARAFTRLSQVDRPMSYLPVTLGAMLLLLGGSAWQAGLGSTLRALPNATMPATAEMPLRIFVAVLISLAVLGVIFLRRWTTQLIALSVAGFLTTFYFVIYRAPDLALTQILVEAVSLILILLLLGRFPRSAERGESEHPPSRARRLVNIILSVSTGITMTSLILVMTAQPYPNTLGALFLRETAPLAQGQNAVNTVLIDFRGFDTLGEITVLLVATLGCLGLLLRYKRTPDEYREGAAGAAGYSEAEQKERR